MEPGEIISLSEALIGNFVEFMTQNGIVVEEPGSPEEADL